MKIPLYFFSYRKTYYLTHPWKWFKDLHIGIKNAWHRMRYGWAWVDLWNMDVYLDQLIPNMMRELSKRSMGYPGCDEFPTAESWEEWLRTFADLYEVLQIDSFMDEEIKDARKKILEMPLSKYDEVRDLVSGAQDIAEFQFQFEYEFLEELRDYLFPILSRHWYDLWD